MNVNDDLLLSDKVDWEEIPTSDDSGFSISQQMKKWENTPGGSGDPEGPNSLKNDAAFQQFFRDKATLASLASPKTFTEPSSREDIKNFIEFTGGGFENTRSLAEHFKNTSENPVPAAPHVREPMTLTGDHKEQPAQLGQFINFAEQLVQGQLLLEQRSSESVCLSLVRQEPDPRNTDAMLNFVTYHELRKNEDGTYTLQQIPAVHKIMTRFTDDAEVPFAQILQEGFTPLKGNQMGSENVIIYPEGQRAYFTESAKGGSDTQSEDYYVELWSSYIAYDPNGHIGREELAPRFFDDQRQETPSIYSGIAFTPPKDIRGVIVLPKHLSADEVSKKTQDYHNRYAGQEFTFLQRTDSGVTSAS